MQKDAKMLLAAVATDDKTNLINRHFGDALLYNLYEMDSDGFKLIKTISNITDKPEKHGDPKKAKAIINLLAQEKVQVFIGKAFGPNIGRLNKKFVCVVVRANTVRNACEKTCRQFHKVIAEWKKGEDRKQLVI